jgi:hypothetical protein
VTELAVAHHGCVVTPKFCMHVLLFVQPESVILVDSILDLSM